MNQTTKLWIAFNSAAAVGVVCGLFWLWGFDFNARGETALTCGIFCLAATAALDGCKHWLRTNKVTFVGHSLGGAVAMLAASVTADASRVMTFGAPRVGDQTFAEHIGGHCELLQFWNVGDPVPHLPLADPWRGYRHPKPQRYLAADGTVYQSRAAVWLDLFRAVGLRCGRALELVLPAHQMTAYLDRLSLATGLG